MPKPPARPRSQSYTGPVTAKPTPQPPPPFHPINSAISDEHRTAHNLRVLQRHDPAIRVIHDQIPYAVIRLMKPRGDADQDAYWEHQLDGPEGPLFFVEREAESLDSRLGFAVLNTKDIFSWIQVLHRGDEIEFSPEMAIIVPSSRKDVMWPAILMKASDGLYAPFIIRLLARLVQLHPTRDGTSELPGRSHLLLKYGLEWPDRWKVGQGMLPEHHIPDPQSAAHDPSKKPHRENDLLSMLMVGSQITEIERVAEEIVRVVASGGTWCRNEYIAPETGWPAEWEEPKGTTKDVWGPVVANPIPGETTVTRATLTTTSSLSDASTIQPPPKKPSPAPSEKKRSPQPPVGRVLNDDVLSNLLQAPMKTIATPPRQNEDEHKTPIPSDFRASLPNVSKPEDDSTKSRRAKAKAKAKKKGKESLASTSALESESSMAEAESTDEVDTNPSRSVTSTPAPIWKTPTFGIVDDRLSDEDGDLSKESTSVPSSVAPLPTVTQEDVRNLEKMSRKKGKQKEPQPPAKPPTFLKYHQKGYVPENTDATAAIDPGLTRDILVSVLTKKGGGFPALERNDWVRELLQLIHTDKNFVDSIYTEYRARQPTS